jgi:hypothetical protein
VNESVARIEAIIGRKVKRDIGQMTEWAKGNLARAAEAIMNTPNAHVGIVTGFYISMRSRLLQKRTGSAGWPGPLHGISGGARLAEQPAKAVGEVSRLPVAASQLTPIRGILWQARLGSTSELQREGGKNL